MGKLKYLIIMLLVMIFSGCSIKMTSIKEEQILFKSDKVEDELHNKRIYLSSKVFNKKMNGLKFDVYNIKFLKIKPYLKIFDYYAHKPYRIIALSPEKSWARGQGFTSRSSYRDSYTFMMFILNENPLKEELLHYFNTINTTYENKLNPKDINKFVKYDCDKNIVFSKYERDEDYKPLKATCYAKRLDKDVFLITRFAHPNTQKDKKLFEEEIIPTMLKSIKVTPTKLSPWKYY